MLRSITAGEIELEFVKKKYKKKRQNSRKSYRGTIQDQLKFWNSKINVLQCIEESWLKLDEVDIVKHWPLYLIVGETRRAIKTEYKQCKLRLIKGNLIDWLSTYFWLRFLLEGIDSL